MYVKNGCSHLLDHTVNLIFTCICMSTISKIEINVGIADTFASGFSVLCVDIGSLISKI